MKMGFTGTQVGMTPAQKNAVTDLLLFLDVDGRLPHGVAELHHGDCVGADANAHALAVKMGIRIVVHPPEYGGKRAWCKGWAEMRLTKPYLSRNHDIVDETEGLIATPKEFEEQLRSGTWATVRYARKLKRPVWVVYPDGTVKEEAPR